MSSLTPDEVRRIASLARIELEPAEEQGVAERLNRVLGLIDQIQKQDTRGIAPMAHPLDGQLSGQPPVAQRLRPDEVVEKDSRQEFQKIAPAVEGGLYLVPKVIE
jgi:aspartyl-tRNA(Asn)/glutamyl-tRNA(Gln) amidotransferase subunit C